MGKTQENKLAKTARKKGIYKNIFKWMLIIGLLTFAFFKNQEFMLSAIGEVKKTALPKLLLCMLFANLYFVAEGSIISSMTASGEKKLTLFQGMSCAYMCAFYRLATLGSGNGLAQLYYYNTKGITVSRGTGMALSQYTFQKITIGIMGVLSFFILLAFGEDRLLKYIWFMFAGVLVISFICIFLFVITVSKKISDLLMKLARKIIKEKNRLYKKLGEVQHAIDNLQEQGRIVWKDKKLFVRVVLLNIIKFACWYVIPGVLFSETYSLNIFFCLALMAVCNMLGCVMVAPSGVGTLDFVFALFFGSIISQAKAVAAAIIIYRFFTWVVPFIIGLIPAAFLKRENPV